MLNIGDLAPEFEMAITGGKKISANSLMGKKYVLYFYPKDDTPGCTVESKDFSEAIEEFSSIGVSIYGVSKDSLKSHDKFREKYCLAFPLATDEEGNICEAFNCWVEKSMYGKKYMGIERSTFLIDERGVIHYIWRKVSVTGHVREVLEIAKKM